MMPSMTRRTLTGVLVLASLVCSSIPASAVPGELDPGFGEDGWVVTELGGGVSTYASAVVVQPDGKIVVAGSAFNRFAVIRYLSDGSLDASFGAGGKVSTAFGGTPSGALALTLQLDGKLLVAGYAGDWYGKTVRMAVARYLPDGSLDLGFGDDGRLVVPARRAVAFAAHVAADGGILLGGCRPCGYRRPGVQLIKLTTTGSLDRDFGFGGRVRVPTGSRIDDITFGDEVILAVTHRAGRMTILRFGSDGALDAAFGDDGIRSYRITGVADLQAAVDAAGRIVVGVGRYIYGRATVVRLTRTGSWDTSFSEDGIASVDVAFEHLCGVLTDRDGNVLIGGGRWAGGGSGEDHSAIARLEEDGTPDGSFGDQGIVDQPGPADIELTNGCDDLALQPDGKVVLVTSYVGGYTGRPIMAARFMVS